MIIAISILSTFVVLMSMYLISLTMLVKKIQKNLNDSNAKQDKMFEKHALYSRDLALSIKDIQDYLVEQKNIELRKEYVLPFNGPIGEA